jgi:hypothetical protein
MYPVFGRYIKIEYRTIPDITGQTSCLTVRYPWLGLRVSLYIHLQMGEVSVLDTGPRRIRIEVRNGIANDSVNVWAIRRSFG